MKTEYEYLQDGLDSRGEKLPDVPILWLELGTKDRRLRGPCLVDTGFDGGLYANADLASFLEGLSPERKVKVYSIDRLGIDCEVFSADGHLIAREGWKKVKRLKSVDVYVPMRPRELSREVIVGREILNEIPMSLDGEKLKIL